MEGNLLTKADITEAIAYQGGQLLAELHNNVEVSICCTNI